VAHLAQEHHRLEQEMMEAQKLESIGRLAGGVAHDFNNLLTAMIGHAELAKQTEGLPEEAREDLDVILEAARRGATVTRDLLTYSRKELVQPRPIEVALEVKRLRPMLEHLVREDIVFELDLDPDSGWVEMDPSQLERALMNLVVNAVDAQPRGGGIVITVEPMGESGVCVSVTDEGEGMSPEVLARAFEPFFTTKEPGKGTGLGLASVYGMAQQAGGDVHIESEVGAGTRVALLLPRKAPESAETRPTGVTPQRVKRERVLLVEDDDAVRHLAKRVLERAGYEVQTAPDGASALALVQRGRAPDILVTDEVMPGMSGHELVDALKAKAPDMRALVCSGHAEDLIAPRELEAHKAEFLQKPYTPTQLLTAVAALAS